MEDVLNEKNRQLYSNTILQAFRNYKGVVFFGLAYAVRKQRGRFLSHPNPD